MQEIECVEAEAWVPIVQHGQSNRRLLALRPQLGIEPQEASRLRHRVWEKRHRRARW